MPEQELKHVHKKVAEQESIVNFIQSLSPFLMFLFCVTKKVYLIIALKNSLDPYFCALIIRLFLNLGSESKKGNTFKTFFCCV